MSDVLSFAEAYTFWAWWYRKHSAIAYRLNTSDRAWVWGQSYREYLHFLGDRSCPACHGAQTVTVTPQEIRGLIVNRTWCICQLLQQLETENPLESLYRHETFGGIQTWNTPSGAGKRTKEIIEDAKDFVLGPTDWRFLNGGFGAGKTKILAAIKGELRGLALYLTTSDLAGYAYDAVGKHTVQDLVNEISSVPVLLIDDLGTEHGKNSEYLYAVMYAIFNNRYILERRAPTYITSNITPQLMLTSSDHNLRRIGTRLSDTDLVTPLVSMQADYRAREMG